MDLVRANKVPIKQVEHFVETNAGLDLKSLLKSGYVMIVDEKIEGCFVLEQVDGGFYWLKQLYITKAKANTLPFLFESILVLAKEKQANGVYVHSHQPTVDIILEALQFHPQKKNAPVDKYLASQGNWWSYKVS